MTGQQQSTGKQESAAVKLYMSQHGDTVAGKKIELIIRTMPPFPTIPGASAQELIVNDKVDFLAGFGVTPAALAVAPLVDRSQGARDRHRGRHLDHHRASRPISCAPASRCAAVDRAMADWAAQERHQESRDAGVRLRARASTPRNRSTTSSRRAAARSLEAIRVPLANPDFAPFLQRVADAKPDALFVFVPSGQGGVFVKQFVERGLDKAGIKIIGPGDVTDDDLLNGMGDADASALITAASVFGRSRLCRSTRPSSPPSRRPMRHAAELHGGRRL